jgi:hypothetical protein
VLRWAAEQRIGWHYIAPGKADAKRLRRKLSMAGCATNAADASSRLGASTTT